MVLLVRSAGSYRTTPTPTFGRSCPVPFPWNGVQLTPRLVVRKRWPSDAGTLRVKSSISGAVDEPRYTSPTGAPVAPGGKATMLVKDMDSSGWRTPSPLPPKAGASNHRRVETVQVQAVVAPAQLEVTAKRP